jgi:hypothetical protein
MNKALSWKILIPLGVILIILGNGGALAFLGTIVTLMGVVDLFRKKKNSSSPITKDKPITEEDLEGPTDILGGKPRKGTEAHRVELEVQRRRKLAESKGVPDLIKKVYFDSIYYYPSWISNGNRDSVPEMVTSALRQEKKGKKGSKDITLITLNGNEYRFEYEEESFSLPDGEWANHGTLELFFSNKKILALSVSREDDQYSTWYSVFRIDAFIDGNWIEDFEKLSKQIEIDRKVREIKRAEDPQKINKLKDDFGIE